MADKIKSLLICCIICLVNFGYSQDLVTDRPDFTESATTVPRGLWQLEFGYTFTREMEAKDHSFGELLIRVSPLNKLEFRLGLASLYEEEDLVTEYFASLALGISLNFN